MFLLILLSLFSSMLCLQTTRILSLWRLVSLYSSVLPPCQFNDQVLSEILASALIFQLTGKGVVSNKWPKMSKIGKLRTFTRVVDTYLSFHFEGLSHLKLLQNFPAEIFWLSFCLAYCLSNQFFQHKLSSDCTDSCQESCLAIPWKGQRSYSCSPNCLCLFKCSFCV